MLTAVGLFLSITAAPHTTAVWTRDDEWMPILKVTANGRTRVITENGRARVVKEGRAPLGHVARESFADAQFHGLRFHGLLFKGTNTHIVNGKTGEAVALPEPPGTPSVELVPRCSGGIGLKTCMFWLYSWYNGDQMGEPVGAVYAFLVGEKGGMPRLLKTINLAGVAGGHYWAFGARYGDTLMFQGDSWPRPGIAIMNVNTFKFTVSHSAGIVMSDSGRVYWQDGNDLRFWSWASQSWKLLRRQTDHLEAAFGVGSDDLLKCKHSIALAQAGSVFRIQSHGNGARRDFQVFLERGLGVGVVWQPNPDKPEVKGSFLRLKDLAVLCPVTQEPKSQGR